jgi:hypothetical protein
MTYKYNNMFSKPLKDFEIGACFVMDQDLYKVVKQKEGWTETINARQQPFLLPNHVLMPVIGRKG